MHIGAILSDLMRWLFSGDLYILQEIYRKLHPIIGVIASKIKTFLYLVFKS